MSRCRLSNKLLDLGLSHNELAVFAYLCSIHSTTATLLGDMVKVKQSTIAQKCGFKTTETVSRIITSLMAKGLIQQIIRILKADANKGTNSYILNKPSNVGGYFYVDRDIFNSVLSARQLKVYLFIARSFSSTLGYCWNSYNDISRQLGMKRSDIIEIINQLNELNLIRKGKRKSKSNRRVYVDNHYFLVLKGKLKKICGKRNRRHSSSEYRLFKNFFAKKKHIFYLLTSQNIIPCAGQKVNIFLSQGVSP